MTRTAKALEWIVGVLNEEGIPFQIVGGLAAVAYGSQRSVLDIDIVIPDEAVDRLIPRVEGHITRPLGRYVSDLFDVSLLSLEYMDQEIDFCLAPGALVLDSRSGRWIPMPIDFQTSELRTLWGITVPVMRRKNLIEYKEALARSVDICDVNCIRSSE